MATKMSIGDIEAAMKAGMHVSLRADGNVEFVVGVEAKEREINKLAQELYQANRTFRPCYPWIFLRILPKTQKVGSIYTPEHEQNKTIHEGIVIATWQPFTKEVGYVRQASADDPIPLQLKGFSNTYAVAHGTVKMTRTIEKKSQFKIGDHVLIPHWSGQPITGFDSKYYRVVKEEEWDEKKEGGIFAVVDYSPVVESAREKLRQLLVEVEESNEYAQAHQEACGAEGDAAPDHGYVMGQLSALVAAKIEAQFLLVDREASSVTLSGR